MHIVMYIHIHITYNFMLYSKLGEFQELGPKNSDVER